MTIEQAIEHAEEIATSAIGCECREEHRQLAEWLRELQERRKAPEIIRCSECAHFRKEHDGEMWCGVSKGHSVDKDFFCGDAERRRTDDDSITSIRTP